MHFMRKPKKSKSKGTFNGYNSGVISKGQSLKLVDVLLSGVLDPLANFLQVQKELDDEQNISIFITFHTLPLKEHISLFG